MKKILIILVAISLSLGYLPCQAQHDPNTAIQNSVKTLIQVGGSMMVDKIKRDGEQSRIDYDNAIAAQKAESDNYDNMIAEIRNNNMSVEDCMRKANHYYYSHDYTDAFQWFQYLAEKGNAEAQYRLGFMYGSGDGVAKDERTAFGWYQQAANQGYARAQCGVGICYEYGGGVKRNKKMAIEYYRKAAAQGNEVAQDALRRLKVH